MPEENPYAKSDQMFRRRIPILIVVLSATVIASCFCFKSNAPVVNFLILLGLGVALLVETFVILNPALAQHEKEDIAVCG